jgi:hypothetical protein
MVFNRALLPRALRIAKIGVEPQRFVGCELTSIVECDRGQGLLWHRFEEPPDGRGRGEAFLSGLLGRQNEAVRTSELPPLPLKIIRSPSQ